MVKVINITFISSVENDWSLGLVVILIVDKISELEGRIEVHISTNFVVVMINFNRGIEFSWSLNPSRF